MLNLPIIEPQDSYEYELESSPWHSLWESCLATEIFLTVTAELGHSTRWAKEGHIVASAQLCLPAKRNSAPHVYSSVLSIQILGLLVLTYITV